jgi:hypothetical protein
MLRCVSPDLAHSGRSRPRNISNSYWGCRRRAPRTDCAHTFDPLRTKLPFDGVARSSFTVSITRQLVESTSTTIEALIHVAQRPRIKGRSISHSSDGVLMSVMYREARRHTLSTIRKGFAVWRSPAPARGQVARRLTLAAGIGGRCGLSIRQGIRSPIRDAGHRLTSFEKRYRSSTPADRRH